MYTTTPNYVAFQTSKQGHQSMSQGLWDSSSQASLQVQSPLGELYL